MPLSRVSTGAMPKFLIHTAVFLTPLIFSLSTRELFEFPKMVLIYLLAAPAAFCLLFYSGFKRRVPANFLVKTLVFLIIVYFLSTALSMDINTSLFGYYTRFNGGFISLLAYSALFFLTLAALSKKEIFSVSFLLSLGSLIVGSYAFLQHLGFDKNFWVQDSQARAFSTLGQPNWLAAYLLMVWPIAFYSLLTAVTFRERLFYFSSCLLSFTGIWFAYSLSGSLGLVFILTTIIILFDKKLLKKNRGVVLILTICCLAIAIKEQGVFGARLKSIPAVLTERLSAYAAEQPMGKGEKIDTSLIRIVVWKGALNLFRSNVKVSLIGTGPETFAYAFLPFRPTELNATTEWDFLYNKAHNYYLDILTNTGGLGMLAHLLFVYAVIRLYKKGRADAKARMVPFFTGWLSLSVTNVFGWPTVPSSLLFFLFPAFMMILNSTDAGGADVQKTYAQKRGRTVILTKTAVVLLLVLGLKTTLNIFLADVNFAQAMSLSKQGLLKEADEKFVQAIRQNPLEPAYRREYAFNLSQEALISGNEGDEIGIGIITEALLQAEIAERLNPHNSLTLKSLLRTYYVLSKISPAFEKKVANYATKVTHLASTEPRAFYDTALIFSYMDKNTEAADYVQRAIKLKPDYEEAVNLLRTLTNPASD